MNRRYQFLTAIFLALIFLASGAFAKDRTKASRSAAGANKIRPFKAQKIKPYKAKKINRKNHRTR